MTGASRILWDAKGRPSVDDAEEHAGLCWVCARPMSRGVRVDRWQGANFTGQNKVRAPAATHVCEPCIWSMQGTPPNCLRMYSHLWADGEGYIAPNKGDKPAMLAFLRKHHAGAWLAAIADSGKKQLVPWTPVNPPGSRRGRILFEDQEVTLPVADGAGWSLFSEIDSPHLAPVIPATYLPNVAGREPVREGDYEHGDDGDDGASGRGAGRTRVGQGRPRARVLRSRQVRVVPDRC